MAGLQVIYYPKRKGDDPRGRRRVKGYRVTMKTPGAPITTIFLSVHKYAKADAGQCQLIAAKIESAYKMGAPLDDKTARILNEYPNFKKALIEKAILDAKRETTLAEIWNRYETTNAAVLSANAMRNKKNAMRRFFQYFDTETPAAQITKQQAQAFKNWLAVQPISDRNREPIAEATAAGIIRDVKALFNWTVENELIEKKPFNSVKKGSMTNAARIRYISPADTQRILDACPSQEWRVAFLLWRLQGLRKNEALLLKWDHVDLSSREMTIPSPKTANTGKSRRRAPIGPTVCAALELLKEEQRRTGERSPLVLPGIPTDPRRPFEKIVIKAGLIQWGRLFQNLRASASTDARRLFGVRFEAETMGHSPETADKHYITLTPADIADAKARDAMTDARAGSPTP